MKKFYKTKMLFNKGGEEGVGQTEGPDRRRSGRRAESGSMQYAVKAKAEAQADRKF